jgi:hypothetical protein
MASLERSDEGDPGLTTMGLTATALPTAAVVLDDPRWTAVEQVAASRNFAKSVRLSAFLLYIARCAIEDRTKEITEQQIGVHVFGRAPGYNAGEDNIVRTTARQLRQRLALYYQEEGTEDEIRIHVPRGDYIPVFETAEAPLHNSSIPPLSPIYASASASAAPAQKVIHRHWSYIVIVLLVGAVLALLFDRGVRDERYPTSGTDLLWKEIFSSGQKTLFVPGDAGLNLYNVFAGMPRQLSLNDYANGNYRPLQMQNLSTKITYPWGIAGYVGMSDLVLADRLTKLRCFRREHYDIRFPRDLAPDAFHNVSAILVGAPPYNPWVELFDGHLNFHFEFFGPDHSMLVTNRRPQAGELSRYEFRPDHNVGFGYIALTDNPEGSGKILLIEGTSHAGVDIAASFLFNDERMVPIISKANNNRRSLSNFEVLLQAPFLKSRAGNIDVLATRFYARNQ